MSASHGWSLRSRSLWSAVGFSVLWHLFWFFSINITVSPSKINTKPRPRVISLGPVLDDAIFRTLVDSRPQVSEALYRRLSDFTPSAEVEVRTTQRQAVSDVVSLPYSRNFEGAVKDMLSGTKQVPEHEFMSRFRIDYAEIAPVTPAEDDCQGERLPSGACVELTGDSLKDLGTF